MSHCVSKLLSVALLKNISKLQSNITMKWPACNSNTHVCQKKRTNRGLCIYYLKVIEEQVSLSTLFGTLTVSINS